MKRVFCLIILLMFVFAGCADKNAVSEPEISDFTQNAVVNWNGFSYDCVISMQNGFVSVQVKSTQAEGLEIIYNGKTVQYIYNDIKYTAENQNLDFTNPAVAVYDALRTLKSADTHFVRLKDGYEARGETALGEFVLTLNSDYSNASISFINSNLNIEFKNAE